MHDAAPRQAKRDHVVTAKLQKINEMDEDNQENYKCYEYSYAAYAAYVAPPLLGELGFGGCVGGLGLLLFA